METFFSGIFFMRSLHYLSIVDRLGSIYAEHPALIKTLGSAALAVTLAKLANRTNS